jgi:hypothetical protein
MTVTILATAPHQGDPWRLPLVPAVRSPGEAVHAANDAAATALGTAATGAVGGVAVQLAKAAGTPRPDAPHCPGWRLDYTASISLPMFWPANSLGSASGKARTPPWRVSSREISRPSRSQPASSVRAWA